MNKEEETLSYLVVKVKKWKEEGRSYSEVLDLVEREVGYNLRIHIFVRKAYYGS